MIRKPLRLWPGVIVVAIQCAIAFGLPLIVPGQGGLAILAGIAGALLVTLWWLFFSRASWPEKLGAILLMVVCVAVTRRLVHESIRNGMMGFMVYVYAAPLLSLALVAGAAASRGASAGRRRSTLATAIIVACLTLTIVRTNGLSGDADSDFEWRWTKTAEERLLAAPLERAPSPEPAAAAAPPAVPPAAKPWQTAPVEAPVTKAAGEPRTAIAEWPGFRGPARDGVVRGVRIETDWARTPPVELWRRPIGPGWSSFTVAGDRFFTQEQRGDAELVSAYKLASGEPVWIHRDAARFWESNAGAGPRATPTFSNGRLYTLGATGILNALDAADGSVIWSRNAATDTGRKVPDWGIASSPLVTGDIVIVATAGTLAAYDLATGKPRWFGPKGGAGYSSPHVWTIDGVEQVVLVNGPGVIGVSPADGTVLWTHAWAGDSIVQPAVLAGGDLLIGSGSGLAGQTGLLRLSITRKSDSAAGESTVWTAAERWMSSGLKPYFNDFVAHHNNAFGFDGGILACVALEDGARKWKGGRYGHGQLVLLADQNLLLVLSEDGELALVSATPDKFTELARMPAIEGKTWNHPVLVRDLLLVRNGEEMAAFRLPLAAR